MFADRAGRSVAAARPSRPVGAAAPRRPRRLATPARTSAVSRSASRDARDHDRRCRRAANRGLAAPRRAGARPAHAGTPRRAPGAPHNQLLVARLITAGRAPPPREPRRAPPARLSARRRSSGRPAMTAVASRSSSGSTRRPEEIAALQAEIRALAKRRNAVVLAHNYQRPEVQDVADYVGDSLGLSRQAAQTPAAGDHLRRRALHGGDRGDPLAGQARAAARPQGRLLARGDDHRGGRAAVEGGVSRTTSPSAT